MANLYSVYTDSRPLHFSRLGGSDASLYSAGVAIDIESIEIRHWTTADVEAFRAMRLAALLESPDAFGSDHDSEMARPLSYFMDRLSGSVVLAAYLGDAAAGMVGLLPEPYGKYRHKGYIWGLYVTPQARGHGVAWALMRAAIARAEGVVEHLHLKVTEGNDTAVTMYEKLGFKVFGIEPRALKSRGRYFGEVFMARLPDAGAE